MPHGGRLVLMLATLATLATACAQDAGAPNAGAPENEAATPAATKPPGRVFASGFESLADFEGSFIEPPDHLGSASHELSKERTYAGEFAHKGWIYAANPAGESHRAYPTIQFHRTTGGAYECPCTLRLRVWLDVVLDEPGEWFSFVTLARNPSDPFWDAVTVNIAASNPAPNTVAGGVMHLMHVPSVGLREPTFQSSTLPFPMRRWVTITMYFDMDAANGRAAVWQDDKLVSVAPIRGGTGKLEQAHFGLYAASTVDSAVVFNDDLEIVEHASMPDADGNGVGDLSELP